MKLFFFFVKGIIASVRIKFSFSCFCYCIARPLALVFFSFCCVSCVYCLTVYDHSFVAHYGWIWFLFLLLLLFMAQSLLLQLAANTVTAETHIIIIKARRCRRPPWHPDADTQAPYSRYHKSKLIFILSCFYSFLLPLQRELSTFF